MARAATSRGEPFSVIGVGIKVVDDPFREFGVAFVLGILDGLEEFGIAPGAAMPIADCAKIAGLVAFYNEHVDLIVNSVPQERPSV